MGTISKPMKKGTAICNFTGEDIQVNLSRPDYAGVGLGEINCDEFQCKQQNCYYRNHSMMGSTKEFLNAKTIVWKN